MTEARFGFCEPADQYETQNGNSYEIRTGNRVLDLDAEQHGAFFDKRHFQFSHRFAGAPVFQIDRLMRLAQDTAAIRPQDIYYDAGHIEAGTRWNEMPSCEFSVTEAFRRIETADAWIILRRIHLDPDFAPLLNHAMRDIVSAGGPDVSKRVKLSEALVIVTSPRRITAFHIDRECGFLLQLHGSKQVNLFDQNDRDVLPEQEIELFWTRDNTAATYRPHLQSRATVYPLKPGDGVHIPINAPHWVQNGPDISVSLNINFLPSENERGNIYRANYHLRKLGLSPRPPFQSPLVDTLKRPIGALSYHARGTYRAARAALHARRS
jgi:hypothetical protein